MVRPPALALLLACAMAMGCSRSGRRPDADPSLARPALLADIDILEASVREGLLGLTRYTTDALVDAQFRTLRDSLRDGMSRLELYRVVAPALSALHDGHLAVQLPDSVELRLDLTTPLLPLYVRILEGRTYIRHPLGSTPDSLEGAEIVSINGVPISEVLAVLYRATPSDGDVRTGSSHRNEGWAFSRRLHRLLGMSGRFELVLQRPGESHAPPFTVRLDGAPLSVLDSTFRSRFPNAQPDENAADLEFREGVAILTVRRFWGTIDSLGTRDFSQYFDRVFHDISASGSKALILDLRSNPGGQDEAGPALLTHLNHRPFRYFADIVYRDTTFALFRYTPTVPDLPAEHLRQRADGYFHWEDPDDPTLGIMPPADDVFGGPKFILMDGRSFSTTAEFLSVAKFLGVAVFLGEESGGASGGDSGGYFARLVLPNSLLVVRIPLGTYYLAVSGDSLSRGVLPDHAVTTTIRDVLAGFDPVLARAMALARAAPGRE